jgi:hypothetical protein
MEERQIEMVPFPGVPAEAPGMITQYKNLVIGENVIKNEPISTAEERVITAAENSGLEFGSVANRHSGESYRIVR